jgi:hypothetical protein
MDWRLSDDAQLPDLATWGITEHHWMEFHEGLLGESYLNVIPDWIRDDYFSHFPSMDELTSRYRSVDWEYYLQHSSRWFDQWMVGIGL